MHGNNVPPARSNYGDVVNGPWVFGALETLPDGRRDFRMVPVSRRDRATLRPLITRLIAPGTTIISDEWGAYRGLEGWGMDYTHLTVNHSENFVNPNNGAHTQNVERAWRDLRFNVLKKRNGYKSGEELRGLLAEHWWRGLHGDHPFLDFLDEVRRQNPV